MVCGVKSGDIYLSIVCFCVYRFGIKCINSDDICRCHMRVSAANMSVRAESMREFFFFFYGRRLSRVFSLCTFLVRSFHTRLLLLTVFQNSAM